MTTETTFRIDLPTLFANINARRRGKGLPAVEPAVMAVRASIKFAIRRQKHINLKSDELNIGESDARHLCEAFRELFDIDMQVGPEHSNTAPPLPEAPADKEQTSASSPEAHEPPAIQPTVETLGPVSGQPTYQLPLVKFYAAFNQARRQKGLMPVEPAIISVRTGVKFAIMRHKTISLQATRATLDEDDIKALDQILAQQFDVVIPHGLISLCDQERPAATAARGVAEETATATPKREGGLIARVLGQFMGEREQVRQYSLDVNNLLMAIVKRRAYMGHKPISPEAIRKKCSQNLHAELHLETDMRNPELALSVQQLDAFAAIIRREFQIMFDDLNDLIAEPLKPSPARPTKLKRSEK